MHAASADGLARLPRASRGPLGSGRRAAGAPRLRLWEGDLLTEGKRRQEPACSSLVSRERQRAAWAGGRAGAPRGRRDPAPPRRRPDPGELAARRTPARPAAAAPPRPRRASGGAPGPGGRGVEPARPWSPGDATGAVASVAWLRSGLADGFRSPVRARRRLQFTPCDLTFLSLRSKRGVWQCKCCNEPREGAREQRDGRPTVSACPRPDGRDTGHARGAPGRASQPAA